MQADALISEPPGKTIPGRKNPRRNTPRHIVVKLTKIKSRDKILKATRGK